MIDFTPIPGVWYVEEDRHSERLFLYAPSARRAQSPWVPTWYEREYGHDSDLVPIAESDLPFPLESYDNPHAHGKHATLPGLIADLETLHKHLDTGYCDDCLKGNNDGDYSRWPCTTMQIVHKYKAESAFQ